MIQELNGDEEREDGPFGRGWSPETRSHVFDAINSLRRELITLLNERDRRYTERSAQQDKAVVDALAAAEKAVNAALVAADKAVEKEQTNAEKWRANANEWRQAMDDRETRFMSKEEAILTVRAVDERVQKLERGESAKLGHKSGVSETTAIVIAVVMAILFAISAAMSVVAITRHVPSSVRAPAAITASALTWATA